MTDGRDPLELQLESLRPPEVPPALRARIAREIEARPPARARRVRRVLAVTAVAACVVVAVARFHSRRTAPTRQPVVAVLPNPAPARPRPPVTLAAYTRAAGGPSAEVDALLDADAARPLGPGPRAFARSMDELTQ